MMLALFHILIVAPFLLYVAVVRGQLTPFVFTILQILGILILIYHSYRVVVRWKSNSPLVWINIFHVIVVAPVIIYVGNSAYDTPRWAFEILAMMAFTAAGYNLYGLVMHTKEMVIKPEELK
jgi:hypothetical protein